MDGLLIRPCPSDVMQSPGVGLKGAWWEPPGLFPGVSAWVNRLFEVSENWISEAALLFLSPFLALKLIGAANG